MMQINACLYQTFWSNSFFSNQGLWDQHLALQWVKENISYFGGDPNNVTLCGYGSGSVCASYHLFSSQSIGLFHRVILMSGTLATPLFWSAYNSIDVGKKLAEEFGIEDNEDLEVFTDTYITNTIHVDTNDSIEDLQEKSQKLNNLKSTDIATNVIDAVIPSKKQNLQFPTDKCNDFFIKQKKV